VLYVSGASLASVRAIANARRLLSRYDRRQVSLQVCDVAADPAGAGRDRIAFTPTLCTRAPAPPIWIVGDLSHPEALVELLEHHGVYPAHGHR
jgi:circadian clock protein KaiB